MKPHICVVLLYFNQSLLLPETFAFVNDIFLGLLGSSRSLSAYLSDGYVYHGTADDPQ